VDLGCVVVVLAVVGGAFDAVVFGEVAFDDAGVGALPSFWIDDVEDFGDGVGGCLIMFTRGESPPAR
jgi:hypothetical protein